jgi:hypothetical protein
MGVIGASSAGVKNGSPQTIRSPTFEPNGVNRRELISMHAQME